MSTIDVKAENQRNYRKLIVVLEASQGILNLLIAVSDDRNLREILIRQYETELRQQDFLTYRVRVRNQDPSLRYALAQLVEAEPDLQQGKSAVITVLGVDDLLSVKLDAPKSEQDRFFGYLQWTREALRQFRFPIVLWLTEPVLVRLAEKAPDFWSWRGGVFWFTRESTPVEIANISVSNPISRTAPKEIGGLPLEEILRLIEQIEAEEKEAPLLATLYDSLARAYQQRYDSYQERQLAIKAYEKAITLQRKLGLQADLASSLKNLGDLYFELKDEVKRADDCYQQALEFYREVGARLGEANTLIAIGDVLQFLKRSSEALNHYSQALEFYREVGARLGEANTLIAIGDVLQFLKRSSEALNHYSQALEFYREVGARLGEANVLQELSKLQQNHTSALEYLQQAQNLYTQIGDIYSQSRNLRFIAELHLIMEQPEAAIDAFKQSAELASAINFVSFQEYAQSKISEINSNPLFANGEA